MNHPVKGKLFIFDADGTLRRCIAHQGPCHSDNGQWEIIPGVKETLTHYQWGEKHSIAIATNQHGVALGHRTSAQVKDELVKLLNALDIPFHEEDLLHCPHMPSTCRCAKPSPGMLYEAVWNYLRRLPERGLLAEEDVVFVGDSDADEGAALAMTGITFYWAKDFFGWANSGDDYAGKVESNVKKSDLSWQIRMLHQ